MRFYGFLAFFTARCYEPVSVRPSGSSSVKTAKTYRHATNAPRWFRDAILASKILVKIERAQRVTAEEAPNAGAFFLPVERQLTQTPYSRKVESIRWRSDTLYISGPPQCCQRSSMFYL